MNRYKLCIQIRHFIVAILFNLSREEYLQSTTGTSKFDRQRFVNVMRLRENLLIATLILQIEARSERTNLPYSRTQLPFTTLLHSPTIEPTTPSSIKKLSSQRAMYIVKRDTFLFTPETQSRGMKVRLRVGITITILLLPMFVSTQATVPSYFTSNNDELALGRKIVII